MQKNDNQVSQLINLLSVHHVGWSLVMMSSPTSDKKMFKKMDQMFPEVCKDQPKDKICKTSWASGHTRDQLLAVPTFLSPLFFFPSFIQSCT